MRCLVSSFFQLILGVPYKLILNIVNKSLGISEVYQEEGFELGPRNWSGVFMAALVLNPSEPNGATKE